MIAFASFSYATGFYKSFYSFFTFNSSNLAHLVTPKVSSGIFTVEVVLFCPPLSYQMVGGRGLEPLTSCV